MKRAHPPSQEIAGQYNRNVNKLPLEDRAAHDWYRFVLSFPSHLVRDYLQRFGINSSHCVLDPFCGTGTTLVECKKLGIPSVGIEANPMAHFAAKVKVDWSPDPDGLIEHSSHVAADAFAVLESQGIQDDPLPPLFQRPRKAGLNLQTLPAEKLKLLLENSISPLPLHKTLILLASLQRASEKKYHSHQLLALAKALVTSISNLHFGPEVGVGPPKSDISAIGSWLATVRNMAEGLRQVQALNYCPAVVHRSDSRELVNVLEHACIDAVITSPPYPNEKDYTRTTRLESVLLGFVNSRDDLQALKRRLVRSNTRGVYKGDNDDLWVSERLDIQQLAEAIEARRIQMGKTSGFERLYARVTKLYFGGMTRHLAQLRAVLRPGAHLAYVVGDQASYLRVMIRTGQLLAEIAQSLGYELVGIDLFRTRLATATKENLREEVVVLRWPGWPTTRIIPNQVTARQGNE